MSQVDVVYDYGIECIRKSSVIHNSSKPVEYSLRTFNVNSIGLSPYDTIYVSYPLPTQEIYYFLNAGTTVTTVTLDYTNSTKADLLSAVKS